MIMPWNHWIIAALLALAIAMVAMRLRALSPSGVLAAIVLGTTVVGTGGWWPGSILVLFFVSSSIVSKLSAGVDVQARGSRRDWVQVAANGWGMLLGCVLFAFTQWHPWLLFGIGAIAAATADTWSSEIGKTSVSPPRLITTLTRVETGTSGAISVRGTLATVAGALFIAVVASIGARAGAFGDSTEVSLVLIGITVAGIGGSVIDSFLGATMQEQRWCDACRKRTETNPHRCGAITRHISGVRGFNNDVVNILCVGTGALIGLFSSIL